MDDDLIKGVMIASFAAFNDFTQKEFLDGLKLSNSTIRR